MRIVTYLSPEELIEIQAELIDRFGGTHGIRDRGLLESACYRPQSGYYPTILLQAAALLQSLAMSHIFVDGNKRIAWVATKTFLAINRMRVIVQADAAEDFLSNRVIVAHCEIDEIAGWLELKATQATR